MHYWVNYVTMTWTSILGFSRSNLKLLHLRNSWSDWCEIRRKQSSWKMNQLCDFALWSYTWHRSLIFMVTFNIALFHEWESQLTWNEIYVNRPFMAMTVTSGWPCGWMYGEVTGVTSDVSIASEYLVFTSDDLYQCQSMNVSYKHSFETKYSYSCLK